MIAAGLSVIESQTIRACQAAGKAIESVRADGISADYKDQSKTDPVTAADYAADALLKKELTTIIPGSCYFGEESDEEGSVDNPYCWIVDPLDGTKEFIRNIPEYVVSVLLQKDGEDLLAVIYNPATQTTISGTSGGVLLDDMPAQATQHGELKGARALASRTETEAGEWDNFQDLDLVTTGSVAWKCALVAAGQADLTFTLRPRHVWDVGAGFALVRWAGGRISNKEGGPVPITPTHEKVRCFLASNGLLHAELLERLEDVPLGPDRRS
ncbi:MAG: inositol monophosphatase family protein [Mariprofundaceae bacterium]